MAAQAISDLIAAARRAASYAYCPYSNYAVGAAVRGMSGTIYTGCNVENISYGLSNCAERTAIFKAVSSGERQFTAVAVVGGQQVAAAPCGACRQVLAEFCESQVPLYFANLSGGEITATTVGELLPHGFKALR